MNKEDLIKAISCETGRNISQDKIRLILNNAVKIISRTLDHGESVKWSGFGSMVLKKIPPRWLYSPSKKGYIVSKGSEKVVFRPSKKKRNGLK